MEQKKESVDFKGGHQKLSSQKSKQKKKMKKSEENLRHLCNTTKLTNIYNMRVPEKEKGEKWAESSFKEIMSQNFLNLGK